MNKPGGEADPDRHEPDATDSRAEATPSEENAGAEPGDADAGAASPVAIDAADAAGDDAGAPSDAASAADAQSEPARDADAAPDAEGAGHTSVESVPPADEPHDADGDVDEVRRVIEAALLVAGEPVPVATLARLFEPALPAALVTRLLQDLRAEWSERKVELVQVASGWRFQGRREVQSFLDRLAPEKPPRYSRAVMETLAIIAYQQPVTRGDIEAIRGVAVSTNVVKALEDRQWIETVGHRETPGRPALYATTRTFLDDLGLASLAELPPLAELDPAHLLEIPDAPTKAAEAPLALASPILGADAAAAAEPGTAEDRGEPAAPPAQVLH